MSTEDGTVVERDTDQCRNPAHIHSEVAPVSECLNPDPFGPPAPRSGCRPPGCACVSGAGYCDGDL